jgi:hypothetical protein
MARSIANARVVLILTQETGTAKLEYGCRRGSLFKFAVDATPVIFSTSSQSVLSSSRHSTSKVSMK